MANIKMITLTSDPFEAENGIDSTIQSAYLECINAMTPETDVRIALYMWAKSNGKLPENVVARPGEIYKRLQEKLKECRGTTKDLILDIDYSSPSNLSPFVAGLTNAGAQVYYPKYKNPGEKGKVNGKMHNKTLTFSKLIFPASGNMLTDVLPEMAGKTIYNAVIQSSANVWPNQYTQANQMVLYYQESSGLESPIYDYTIKQLNSIIETLIENTDIEKPLNKFPVISPEEMYVDGQRIIDFAMPRSNSILPHEGNYPNIYETILEGIIQNNTDFRYPPGFTPELRVAMGLFSKRDTAHRMVTLANMGVSVKVISRSSDETEIGIGKDVKDILTAPGSKVQLELLLRKAGVYPNMVHSKFMLYDGPYNNFKNEGAVELKKVAWAGSLNLEWYGLTKDAETLLQMEGEDVYRYLKNSWNKLWEHRTP